MSVNLITNTQNITENERNDFNYDAAQSVHSILLTTINQDIAKQLILERLDDSTAFIIVDFAMKSLSRRYQESMSSWFGKAGNGIHVSCVIMKDNSEPGKTEGPLGEAHEVKFKKRTYITFIGKAAQDVGSMIATYQSLLRQLQTDFPHIKYIIDISDNTGCYRNEVLFTWKAIWPRKTSNISFIETIFNGRQSRKDLCDRDSATAKCQMQNYIERGNNIETPDQMCDPMCKATALSGFTANVPDIAEKKSYPKTT